MNKQKMRAEKPCRTLASEFQTEPYSASYGQKPFWRVPAKILKYLGANPVLKKGNPVFKKGNPAFKKGNPAFKKGNPACKKGNPACKKGNPAFKKGNPACKKDKSCIQERESQWDHGTNGTMGPMGPWDQDHGTGNLMQA